MDFRQESGFHGLEKIDSARLGQVTMQMDTTPKNMTYGIYDLEKFPVSSYKVCPCQW